MLNDDPTDFVYVSEQKWLGQTCVYANYPQSERSKYIRNVTIEEVVRWAQGTPIEDAMPNIDDFDKDLLESMEKEV